MGRGPPGWGQGERGQGDWRAARGAGPGSPPRAERGKGGCGSWAEGAMPGRRDATRTHLRVQLAERGARPAEQTQLQARQQHQGEEPVRDLRVRRARRWAAGAPPLAPQAPPRPLARTCSQPRPPARSPRPSHRGAPVWEVHRVVAGGLRRQRPHQPGQQHGLRRPQTPPALRGRHHPARRDQADEGRARSLGEPRQRLLGAETREGAAMASWRGQWERT